MLVEIFSQGSDVASALLPAAVRDNETSTEVTELAIVPDNKSSCLKSKKRNLSRCFA